MATTTATITLTSTDLLTDSLSLSATQTLYKAGTTTGLDSIQYERLELPTGDVYDAIDATATGANKANKVYIANKSTDATYYIDVYIAALNIGRLYAGDWCFFPWNAGGGTKETFITTIANTWAAGDTWTFDGVTVVAANSTVADIGQQIDEAQFPNWVTARSGAAVTFTARRSVDTGTVVTVTADIVVDTAGDGDAVVSSAALGTRSISDVYIKPSVHTEMILEHMLLHE